MNKGSLNIGIENFKLWLRTFNKGRPLPNFLILGVQKAGTTTLYDYITQHPNVLPAFRKETKYFDLYHQKSINWYKAFFPVLNNNCITGEATPDYFFYKEIPKRIKQVLPNVKLIVLLRNPVDRAVSQYNFNVDREIETLPFEDAINKEVERMSANTAIPLKSGYVSNSYREFSYISRGMYAQQLKQWLKFFPLEHFFICTTKQLKFDTLNTINSVYEFLKLEQLSDIKVTQKNVSKNKVALNNNLLMQLKNRFDAENEILYNIIGKNFNW